LAPSAPRLGSRLRRSTLAPQLQLLDPPIPSNPAVVADSSRQATYHIVAPATAAVCPGIVTRQSQSQSLFENSTDQNAVQVRIEKAGLRYSIGG